MCLCVTYIYQSSTALQLDLGLHTLVMWKVSEHAVVLSSSNLKPDAAYAQIACLWVLRRALVVLACDMQQGQELCAGSKPTCHVAVSCQLSKENWQQALSPT